MRRMNYQEPRRVLERPDPGSWSDTEPMSFKEAERLLMPHGPLTHRSLRAAAITGDLAISVVNRRHFTTKEAVRALLATRSRPRQPPVAEASPAGEPTAARAEQPHPSEPTDPNALATSRLAASLAYVEALRRRPGPARTR